MTRCKLCEVPLEGVQGVYVQFIGLLCARHFVDWYKNTERNWYRYTTSYKLLISRVKEKENG